MSSDRPHFATLNPIRCYTAAGHCICEWHVEVSYVRNLPESRPRPGQKRAVEHAHTHSAIHIRGATHKHITYRRPSYLLHSKYICDMHTMMLQTNVNRIRHKHPKIPTHTHFNVTRLHILLQFRIILFWLCHLSHAAFCPPPSTLIPHVSTQANNTKVQKAITP